MSYPFPRSTNRPPLDQSGHALLERYEPLFPEPFVSDYFAEWVEAWLTWEVPHDFIGDFEVTPTTFELFGAVYDGFTVPEGGAARRHELMQAQVRHVRGPVLDPEYRALDLPRCLLCQTLVELSGTDRFGPLPRRRGLGTFDGLVLIPNRYPYQPGASLLFPDRHRQAFSHGNLRLVGAEPRPAAPAPKMIDPKNLLTTFSICDRRGLYMIKNHPMDSMSIPEHDHVHLVPACLVPDRIRRTFVPDARDALHAARLEYSPFDTLVLSGGTVRDRAAAAAMLLARLDRDGVPYTLVYLDGSLFVTPRHRCSLAESRMKTGGGVGIHLFNPADQLLVQRLMKWVPRRGEFDWDGYLPAPWGAAATPG